MAKNASKSKIKKVDSTDNILSKQQLIDKMVESIKKYRTKK